MMIHSKKILIVSLFLVLTIIFNVESANAAWWDTDWDYCRNITIDSTYIDSTLTDWPGLLILDSGNIDYSNTQDAGEDLRIINAPCNEDGSVVPYEIEIWDEGGESAVHFRVASVASGSDTVYSYYYGNTGASDAQNVTGVWNDNYLGVWHMTNDTTSNIPDSTSNGNNGTMYDVTDTTGWIGGAIDFPGTNGDYVSIVRDSAFEPTEDVTTQAFFNTDVVEQGSVLHHWSGFTIETSSGLATTGCIETTSTYDCTNSNASQTANNWWLVTDVWDGSTDTHSIYDNQTMGDTQSGPSGDLTYDATPLRIGGRSNNDLQTLNGKIDEVRVLDLALTQDWIQADYYSMTDQLVTYGSEMSQPSGTNSFNLVLNSPGDATTNTSLTINFAFTMTAQNTTIENCSLWTNESGWSDKEINTTVIANGSQTIITEVFSTSGDYLWNIECYNESTRKFASSNRSFTIDLAPTVTLNSPADESNTSDTSITFQYTAIDDNGFNVAYLYANYSSLFASPFDGYTNYSEYKPGVDTDNIIISTIGAAYWEDFRVLQPNMQYRNVSGTEEFRLYYSGCNVSNTFSIGMANGSTWDSMTRYAGNPILKPGASGTWDDVHVWDPWIVDNCTGNGTTCMYYSGYDGTYDRIGLAMSNDNVTWWKYHYNKCSGTTGIGCIIGLGSGGEWDDYRRDVPVVLVKDGVLHMIFRGADASGVVWELGYANSTDGVNWTMYDGNPILSKNTSSQWMCGSVGNGKTLKYDSRTGYYHMLFIAKDLSCGEGESSLTSDIGYARSTDMLSWEVYNPDAVIRNDRAWEDLSTGEVENPNAVIVGTNMFVYYDAYGGTPIGIGGINITGLGSKWNRVDLNTSVNNDSISKFTLDLSDLTTPSTLLWNIQVETTTSETAFATSNYTFTITSTSSPLTTCNSCTDCSNYIQNSSSGSTITLSQNLTTTGACIDFDGSDGIIFDCAGYGLDGDYSLISSDYGIYSTSTGADNNTIKGCSHISDFFYGIYLQNSDNNTFYNMTVNHSRTYNIYIVGGYWNNLTDVISYSGNSGIAYLGSDNNTITSCNMSYNTNGVRIDGQSTAAEYNNITDTVFIGNTNGIYIDSDLQDNDNGHIYNNNFTSNTVNIKTLSSVTNYFNITKTLSTNIIGNAYKGGNYYDDYSGFDLNGDGIGDTSYNINGSLYDFLPLIDNDFSTVSVETEDGDQNWTFSTTNGGEEIMSLNFTSTGNVNNTIFFSVDGNLSNTSVVESMNYTTNLTLDDNELIDINITINSSCPTGSYSGNMTWTSYNDTSQSGNITIEFTVSNQVANIDIVNSSWSAAFTAGSTSSFYVEVNNTGDYNATNCNMSYSGSVGSASFDQSDFTINQSEPVTVQVTMSGSTAGSASGLISCTCTATAIGGTDSDSISGSISISAAAGGGGGGGTGTPICGDYTAFPQGGFTGFAPEGKNISKFRLQIYNGDDEQEFFASIEGDIQGYCYVISQMGEALPPNGYGEIVVQCVGPSSEISGHLSFITDTGCDDSRPITIYKGDNALSYIVDRIYETVTGQSLENTDIWGVLIMLAVIVIILLLIWFVFFR